MMNKEVLKDMILEELNSLGIGQWNYNELFNSFDNGANIFEGDTLYYVSYNHNDKVEIKLETENASTRLLNNLYEFFTWED